MSKRQRRPYLGLYVKLYITSLDDIKIREMDAETRCFWMDALLLAKAGRGVLPPLREIAFRLRISDSEARSRIMTLVSLNLIDEDHVSGNVVWAIHAWDKWQNDTLSSERVKRHRERRKSAETLVKHECNVSCNANETLETNSNSNSHYYSVASSSAQRAQGLPVKGACPGVGVRTVRGRAR